MDADFVALGLEPGVSWPTIKQAYRELARRFHPDAQGASPEDAWRFQAAHEAYRKLAARSKPISARAALPAPGEAAQAAPAARCWRLAAVHEQGADWVYELEIRPEGRNGLTVELPWLKEDACPRCLGLGHTLWPMFGGPHLSRAACLHCQSRGVVAREAVMQVNLSWGIIRSGMLRLPGQGRYRPLEARRGDLVILLRRVGGPLEWLPGRGGEAGHVRH